MRMNRFFTRSVALLVAAGLLADPARAWAIKPAPPRAPRQAYPLDFYMHTLALSSAMMPKHCRDQASRIWRMLADSIRHPKQTRLPFIIEAIHGGRAGLSISDVEPLALADEQTGHPLPIMMARQDVHAQGKWHQAVHVYFIDKRGRLILQRRSRKMKTSPGKLQVSVSGHVDYADIRDDKNLEDPSWVYAVAQRESVEESGIALDPDRLVLIGGRANVIWRTDPNNREFSSVLCYFVSDDEIRQIRKSYNTNEVDEWVVLPLGALSEAVSDYAHEFSGSILHLMRNRRDIFNAILAAARERLTQNLHRPQEQSNEEIQREITSRPLPKIGEGVGSVAYASAHWVFKRQRGVREGVALVQTFLLLRELARSPFIADHRQKALSKKLTEQSPSLVRFVHYVFWFLYALVPTSFLNSSAAFNLWSSDVESQQTGARNANPKRLAKRVMFEHSFKARLDGWPWPVEVKEAQTRVTVLKDYLSLLVNLGDIGDGSTYERVVTEFIQWRDIAWRDTRLLTLDGHPGNWGVRDRNGNGYEFELIDVGYVYPFDHSIVSARLDSSIETMKKGLLEPLPFDERERLARVVDPAIEALRRTGQSLMTSPAPESPSLIPVKDPGRGMPLFHDLMLRAWGRTRAAWAEVLFSPAWETLVFWTGAFALGYHWTLGIRSAVNIAGIVFIVLHPVIHRILTGRWEPWEIVVERVAPTIGLYGLYAWVVTPSDPFSHLTASLSVYAAHAFYNLIGLWTGWWKPLAVLSHDKQEKVRRAIGRVHRLGVANDAIGCLLGLKGEDGNSGKLLIMVMKGQRDVTANLSARYQNKKNELERLLPIRLSRKPRGTGPSVSPEEFRGVVSTIPMALQAGLTKSRVVEILGVNRALVIRWERGMNRTAHTIYQLVRSRLETLVEAIADVSGDAKSGRSIRGAA